MQLQTHSFFFYYSISSFEIYLGSVKISLENILKLNFLKNIDS